MAAFRDLTTPKRLKQGPFPSPDLRTSFVRRRVRLRRVLSAYCSRRLKCMVQTRMDFTGLSRTVNVIWIIIEEVVYGLIGNQP